MFFSHSEPGCKTIKWAVFWAEWRHYNDVFLFIHQHEEEWRWRPPFLFIQLLRHLLTLLWGDDNDEWLQCLLFWAPFFFWIAVILWMKCESYVCPMRRAGHNCCTPAVHPLSYWIKYAAQRILLSLLSLFTHKVWIKWSLISFTVKIYIFLPVFWFKTCFCVKVFHHLGC